MKVKPLHDNILVEPITEKKVVKEKKLASGIILPETVKDEADRGEALKGVVKAVGAGKTDEKGNLIKPQVKTGDEILYKKWGGSEIKVGDKIQVVIKEEDILAVVE